jgi:hypothetical protein
VMIRVVNPPRHSVVIPATCPAKPKGRSGKAGIQ